MTRENFIKFITVEKDNELLPNSIRKELVRLLRFYSEDTTE